MLEKLKEVIRRNHFQIVRELDTPERIIIDFKHPLIKVGEPAGYYLSSVVWDKRRKVLETTVRAKVPTYKELYLDYCVENGEMVCRPHFWTEEKIVSVEATFSENPLDKFDRLLNEMRDPPGEGGWSDWLWLTPIIAMFLLPRIIGE